MNSSVVNITDNVLRSTDECIISHREMFSGGYFTKMKYIVTTRGSREVVLSIGRFTGEEKYVDCESYVIPVTQIEKNKIASKPLRLAVIQKILGIHGDFASGNILIEGKQLSVLIEDVLVQKKVKSFKTIIID